MSRAMRPAIFVLWLLVGCAPVLSDFQSAKLVGTGNIEVTPSGGATFLTDSGSASADQREYGVQVATGVAERVDMRARYAFLLQIGCNNSDRAFLSLNEAAADLEFPGC